MSIESYYDCARFIDANLAKMAQELLEMGDTGILPAGSIMQASYMLREQSKLPANVCRNIVETQVKIAALRFVKTHKE